MKIECGEKVLTLEELAAKICASYDECTEACPAFDCCRHGHTGTITWLQRVVDDD